ncbi:hypothetical protein BPA01_47920 [Brevibacillus parabrevis]|uniref:Uncharacterized protein n=1 Tax=Brevibacillus parabrevis TaxID=54914 RepID=A0A4Y3PL22_BREPA|nr:hypothetical protein BPA01_47920 [Brevibacillus parabrevis]
MSIYRTKTVSRVSERLGHKDSFGNPKQGLAALFAAGTQLAFIYPECRFAGRGRMAWTFGMWLPL